MTGTQRFAYRAVILGWLRGTFSFSGARKSGRKLKARTTTSSYLRTLVNMFSKLTTVFSLVVLSATVVLAVPQGGSLVCANDAGATCPPGYTCCGPIIPGVGGNCRKLNPGQVCIF
ncbi:hypothetical protein BJ165DRAFT_1528643 [Panaeolus papilionaceus]|nr:hypothetical protein BJ165DRAFT_1528643 [Panaeolus papilionaceus]